MEKTIVFMDKIGKKRRKLRFDIWYYNWFYFIYTHNEYKLEADKDAKRNDIWHISLAGGVDIAEGLMVVGNVGMETNEDKSSGKDPAFILGGIIYSAS
jgi:hypothetical protein